MSLDATAYTQTYINVPHVYAEFVARGGVGSQTVFLFPTQYERVMTNSFFLY